MRVKRGYFILLLLLFLNYVSAAENYDGDLGGPLEVSEETINSNDWDWQQSNIQGLTSEQIDRYWDNIPPSRFDELNQEELSKALKRRYALDETRIKTGEVHDAQFGADSFFFDSLEYLSIDNTVITNGRNVEYKKGNLTADHADSFIKSGSISTNITKLNAGPQQFHLGRASQLLSDTIILRNIQNASFTIDNKRIEIHAYQNSTLNITDKSFANTLFNASENSQLVITKTIPAEYNITNGSLQFDGNDTYGSFSEIISTQTNALVTIRPILGVSCVSLFPSSTYLYVSYNDNRRDFGVNIPSDGTFFKLCTRKEWVEKYSQCSQCGFIDFIKRTIELNGYASYMRHTIQGIEVLDATKSFHSNKINTSVAIDLDESFIFIPQVIVAYAIRSPHISTTYPNNFYTLFEKEVNGSVHRFLQINKNMPLEKASDNLLYVYTTNYSDFDTIIKHNVLTQKVGTKLTVLPPEHELAGKYLR